MGETLHIHLHSPLRENAEAGQINIFNRIAAALPGWHLVYRPDTEAERLMALARGGYTLFHMHEPPHPRILCLRRAYHYPFWRIEATNERWRFDVAQAAFDPAAVPPREAQGFLRRWRPKVFRDGPVTRDGFAFVPLQGRLRDHRSFQSMSPVAMIEATLDHWRGPVRATLHPKEVYDAADRAALDAIAARHSRFAVVQADARDLLAGCDIVVTQNSSVALTGFFAAKPAVLFAGIDFHHIAGSVPRDGLEAAFDRALGPEPDYAAYLWWFFKAQAINGGAPEAEAQIVARLRRHGWPI